MTKNNVQNVKFLRNGRVFTPSADPVKTAREVALDAMNGQLDNLADGTAILGRYQESVLGSKVMTLVGFAYVSGETRTLTVLDVDGASADVDALRQEINAKLGDGISSGNTATAQLTALSGTSSAFSGDTSVWGAKKYASAYTESIIDGLEGSVTAADGSYVKSVTQVDGKISGTTASLPTVGTISAEGQAITAVSQSNGTVSATAGNIDSQYVNVSYSAITATNVKTALAEIADKINGMDKSASAVDGQVVTTVSETDGVVSETKANVKDLQLGGYAKDTTATGDIASTDTINTALSKLENKAAAITIASDDKTIKVTTSATGTDVAVNIDGTTLIKNGSTGAISSDLKIQKITQSEDSEWAAEYQLVYGSSNQPIGEKIQVAKDQFLKEASYNAETQKLTLVMYNSTGGTTNIVVDFSDAVIETEAGEGLYVKEDHSLNVGIASSSETVTISDGHGGSIQAAVLSVNADNIEVQNIQNAIDYKVSTLDADLSGNTTHVKVGVAEADGKITAVTVNETDIASQSLLDTLSGKAVTEVAMTGGTANIIASSSDGTKKITINTDGSQVLMTSYSKGSASGAVEATDSINAAIGKLENQIAGKVDALDATVTGETTDGKVKVQVVQENGVLNSVTLTGTDIASESALTNEISHRKAIDGVSGDKYTADTTAHYISAATSLFSADKALDTALNSEVTRATTAEAAAKTSVQGSSTAASSDNAVVVTKTIDATDNHDIYTIQLGSLDAGTY